MLTKSHVSLFCLGEKTHLYDLSGKGNIRHIEPIYMSIFLLLEEENTHFFFKDTSVNSGFDLPFFFFPQFLLALTTRTTYNFNSFPPFLPVNPILLIYSFFFKFFFIYSSFQNSGIYSILSLGRYTSPIPDR